MRTLLAIATLALTATLTEAQAPLRVIASNGVKTLVEDLVPAYEKSSGRKATVTYGTSSVLVKDIVGGAPFDVVIATTEAIDQISKAGKVTAEPPTMIGRSVVGVGVKQGARKPPIGTPAEIKQAFLGAKAVTYAGDGASRPGIEKMFATLGITEALKGKSLLERGSNGAIARVVSGDAELLITLVSEIIPAPGVALVGPLPKEFRSEVAFAAAVSATAADPAAARALLASLVSREATATLHQKGLER